MNKYIREPINSISHLIGVISSFFGLLAMIIKVVTVDDFSPSKLTSAIIFGLSLIFLYTASSIYHTVKSSDKVITILRKLDHSMIFVLIAGTYTPICAVVLKGGLRTGVLATVWTLAIVGILVKVFWSNCPRWLYTSFYIAMGWMALTLSVPIYTNLLLSGFLWLLIGGILYTIGGIIYAIKSPNISPKFGFHEIFHIFVLMGSFSHFWLVYKFIL